MSKIDDVKEHVEKGKAKLVPGLVQEALDEGAAAPDILNAMVSAMEVVGDKFSANEIFVPEMLMAAKAMAKGLKSSSLSFLPTVLAPPMSPVSSVRFREICTISAKILSA